MIDIRIGIIAAIISETENVQNVELEAGSGPELAIVYTSMSGRVNVGDRVAFNSTAVNLDLGTGGDHFVICNLDRPELQSSGKGHLMKLKYTPMQVRILAVEEPQSRFHEQIKDACTLEEMPAIAALLHSHIAPAVIAVKYAVPKLKLAYLMTEGGALPADYSRLVRDLKHRGFIDSVITCGQAFGGDHEALNIYSGLLAARHVVKADVAIVAMGPGIAGTSTLFGFSGIEQGQTVNAIDSLGGVPVFIPRISFADQRERHHGLSQQTIVNLKFVVRVPLCISLPFMSPEKMSYIEDQVYDHGLNELHSFYYQDQESALTALQDSGINLRSMSRTLEEDPEFFLTAWLAGIEAAMLVKD